MASVVYNEGIRNALTGQIDFDTDRFDILLVTSSYTPDEDNHADRADVTNEVATGNGYTGPKTTTVTVGAVDATNDRVDISFSDVSWTSSTITAAGAVIFKYTGTASTELLVAYLDFGGNVSSSNGTFTVSVTSPLRFAM